MTRAAETFFCSLNATARVRSERAGAQRRRPRPPPLGHQQSSCGRTSVISESELLRSQQPQDGHTEIGRYATQTVAGLSRPLPDPSITSVGPERPPRHPFLTCSRLAPQLLLVEFLLFAHRTSSADARNLGPHAGHMSGTCQASTLRPCGQARTRTGTTDVGGSRAYPPETEHLQMQQGSCRSICVFLCQMREG